jgi:ribosomal protein L1
MKMRINKVVVTKFDESDRGTFGCRSESESNGKRCVTLPHGTGKDVKVLALVTLTKKRAIAEAVYEDLMNTYKKLKMVGLMLM